MQHGLLLLNLGTPASPDVPAVRRYLRQFLADKRVIALPAPLRYLLLYGIILPFRPKQTARAYKAIWTEHGSPLLYHGKKLADKLQAELGTNCKVVLAMRYGEPSIAKALQELHSCDHITILPLYPQYSSAATGSTLEEVMRQLSIRSTIPFLNIIRDFHQFPGFIQAQAAKIKPYLNDHDYILLSYHGLPENHLLKNACKTHCQTGCNKKSPGHPSCYRAQCIKTSTLLALELQLRQHQFGMSFQSRLGKTPWIKPYTDHMLTELARRGIKRLAVACPSFVSDCLETLEEIGMRAREDWQKLGGEKFTLIPCVNDDDVWVQELLNLTNLKQK
ncbi:ferrochelatase [Legionella septentrionalis]|uniref:Ferrochelatase n=1 Tax=Legionella septentrionalis TaxID=2498109 RepID=A0A433JIA6_9GAMM|nr:ferrochelatase [Legionella septentrionalis]RUQ84989.1 ferrochelatase [Legionella septentrionalis]RUR10318.1 ferrochelatase [Legionella septentrionalis]